MTKYMTKYMIYDKNEVIFLLESDIERYFCREIKNAGGLAMKFVSPGLSGVPDRIVLLPVARIYFVELKRYGKKPRKLQNKVFNKFLKLGFRTYVLDSYESVDEFVRGVTDGNKREE